MKRKKEEKKKAKENIGRLLRSGEKKKTTKKSKKIKTFKRDKTQKNSFTSITKGKLNQYDEENPLPSACSFCGLDYDDFKTGLTFADVRADMWRGEDDPKQWKYKRRHGVLGAWHGAKQMMWREHLDACEAAAADKKRRKKKPTKKEIEKLRKGLEKEFKPKKGDDDDEIPF